MGNYTIEKGDKFLCLEDYIMQNGDIAYTKGVEYISEIGGCITDNVSNVGHRISVNKRFFKHFKIINTKEEKRTSSDLYKVILGKFLKKTHENFNPEKVLELYTEATEEAMKEILNDLM